jgi:TDG/mug DNA glycosylase family protein
MVDTRRNKKGVREEENVFVGAHDMRPFPVKMAKRSTNKTDTSWQGDTLPDYLREGLDVVLVGLNPGLYSARVGHYFAFRHNRFWAALSASGLVPEPVGPEDDARLLEWGIGLTDVAKRPTRGIHELTPLEFRRGAKALQEKIAFYKPHVVCFIGLTGYRVCCGARGTPGRRADRFAGAQVFVIPSTSPRNAHYSLTAITAAFRDLKEFLHRVRSEDQSQASPDQVPDQSLSGHSSDLASDLP